MTCDPPKNFISLQLLKQDLVSRAIPECTAKVFLLNEQSLKSDNCTLKISGDEEELKLWISTFRPFFAREYPDRLEGSLLPNESYKVTLDKTGKEFPFTLNQEKINKALAKKPEFFEINRRIQSIPTKGLKFFLETLKLLSSFRKNLESEAPCYMELFYMKKSEEEGLKVDYQKRVATYLARLEAIEYGALTPEDIQLLSELQNCKYLTNELRAKAITLPFAKLPRLGQKDDYQCTDSSLVPRAKIEKSKLSVVKPLMFTAPIARNSIRAELIDYAGQFLPYGPIELNLLPLFIRQVTGFVTNARRPSEFFHIMPKEFENFISYLKTLEVNDPLSYQRLQGFADSNGNSQYEINEKTFATLCLKIANFKPGQMKFDAIKNDLFALLQEGKCTMGLYYELPQKADGNCGYYTVACGVILFVLLGMITLNPKMFPQFFASMQKALPIYRKRDGSYFDNGFLSSIERFLSNQQSLDDFQQILKNSCTTPKGLWNAAMFLAPAIRLFTCENSPNAKIIFRDAANNEHPSDPRADGTWSECYELLSAAELFGLDFIEVYRSTTTNEYVLRNAMKINGDPLIIGSLQNDHWCLLIPAAKYENLTTLIRDFGAKYQAEQSSQFGVFAGQQQFECSSTAPPPPQPQ
jgi:hypothetical protein